MVKKKVNVKVHETLLRMSHAYFEGRKVTTDAIRVFIAKGKGFYSEEEIDDEWLFQKLEKIHLLP